MAKNKKLNSMRLLETNDVPYEALEYPADVHDAEEVAEVLGVPYHLLYKTLVVQPVGEAKPALAMVASERALDLKKIAKAMGVKKAQMAAHKDAEAMTGLQTGGIGALALMHKNWDVYLDSSATDLEHIMVSAGQRGMQLRVPVSQLIRLTGARVADIGTDVDA